MKKLDKILNKIDEMTGAVTGTTSAANFSPSDPSSGAFVGGKKYKKKLKEAAYIAHKQPSSAGTTDSLTYGKQKIKTFNKSQPDSAAGSIYIKRQM